MAVDAQLLCLRWWCWRRRRCRSPEQEGQSVIGCGKVFGRMLSGDSPLCMKPRGRVGEMRLLRLTEQMVRVQTTGLTIARERRGGGWWSVDKA